MSFRSSVRGMLSVHHPKVFRLAGEAVAVGVGQAIAVAGAIVGVRLLTEYLQPMHYGQFALGMSASILAVQVFLGPVIVAGARFFAPAREALQLSAYLGALKTLLTKASSWLAAVGVATSIVAWVVAPDFVPLTIAAFLFAFVSALGSLLSGVQNAARQRILAAAHDGLSAWLRILAAVLLMRALSLYTSATAMAGYALATALTLGSQFSLFKRRLFPEHSAPSPGKVSRWYEEMKAFGLPFGTWGVFTWLQMVSDRWALGMFASTEEVGLYTAVYQIGYYPLILFSGILVQFVAPILYARAGDATDVGRVRNAVRTADAAAIAVLLATIVVAVVAVGAHSKVAEVLLAAPYRRVSYLLPWMIFAGGLFSVGQVVSLRLMVANRPASLNVPKVGASSLGVIASFTGAWISGITGVVAAAVFFGASFLALTLLVSRKGHG